MINKIKLNWEIIVIFVAIIIIIILSVILIKEYALYNYDVGHAAGFKEAAELYHLIKK